MAQSGQEALEIIEEYASEGYEILLVISDYVMPGMQGDELLKKSTKTIQNLLKFFLQAKQILMVFPTSLTKQACLGIFKNLGKGKIWSLQPLKPLKVMKKTEP